MGKIERRKMKLPEGLEPFYTSLEAVQRLLIKFNERGVIIGGIAVSLLGKPRYTEDLDAMFLLSINDIPRFLGAAKEEGIEPRQEDTTEFARKNRVLLLRHVASDINIDISLGILSFEEEVVERSTVKSVASLLVRLPTPEDLIIMKAIAHRLKDLNDIQAIVQKHPDLDFTRIEHWVRSFAEALEEPELWGEIKKIIDAAK
ncbi:MAG: nucleotidyl transferase AbiEii/AbiGii toxin family protein [Chloroflexi bacterium]|nr:nucleotidyl transferase AbiEii/AbiGii toxin family protein [Chloroflexota bacterium]